MLLCIYFRHLQSLKNSSPFIEVYCSRKVPVCHEANILGTSFRIKNKVHNETINIFYKEEFYEMVKEEGSDCTGAGD
jgi:hypothetical protein